MVRHLVSTILKWFGQCGILFIFAVSCYHTLTVNRKYKGFQVILITVTQKWFTMSIKNGKQTHKLIITHTCATSPLLETSWKNNSIQN